MTNTKKTASFVALLGSSGGIGFGAQKLLQEYSTTNSGNIAGLQVSADKDLSQSVAEDAETSFTTFESTSPDLAPSDSVVPEKDQVRTFIKSSNFELMSLNNNQDNDWWDKIYDVVFKDRTDLNKVSGGVLLRNECSEILFRSYASITKEEYVTTIKKCSKLENMEERSKRLGLVLLSNENDEELKEKWNEISSKADFKKELEESYELETTSENHLTLVNVCSSYASAFNSFSENIETKWKNYLGLCFKNDDKLTQELGKDYWGNTSINS